MTCGQSPAGAASPYQGCACVGAPVLAPINLAQVQGQKAMSTSHVFIGPQVISLISLLQQSRGGNIGIYSIDVDVRKTDAGVMLVRGNGHDPLFEGDSRSWSGTNDGFGLLGSATEFSLTLATGDEVVINWTEIKA